MIKKIRIQYLILEVFSHATEDPDKVKKAAINVLPKELRDKVKFNEVITKGHYGNEIRILTFKLRSEDALNTVKYVLCRMSNVEREIFLSTLEARSEPPSHIYLRLSKQDAYREVIRLLDVGGDVIKLMITVDGASSLNEIRDFLSNLIKVC